MRIDVSRGLGVLVIAGVLSATAFAAEDKVKVDDRLNASADTLTDMMRASDKGIPQDLIDKACCVVVAGHEKGWLCFRCKVWTRVRFMPPDQWLRLERTGGNAS
jgi:hypothetical protein